MRSKTFEGVDVSRTLYSEISTLHLHNIHPGLSGRRIQAMRSAIYKLRTNDAYQVPEYPLELLSVSPPKTPAQGLEQTQSHILGQIAGSIFSHTSWLSPVDHTDDFCTSRAGLNLKASRSSSADCQKRPQI